MIEYEGETYLTANEAASATGISVVYFRLLRKRNGVAAYYFPKYGTSQFFKRSDLMTIFKPQYKPYYDRMDNADSHARKISKLKQDEQKRVKRFLPFLNIETTTEAAATEQAAIQHAQTQGNIKPNNLAITVAKVPATIITNKLFGCDENMPQEGNFHCARNYNDTEDQYGAITLNHKGGGRKKNTNIPVRLDKYAILVMLEIIERAPQKEDETEAKNVFKHDKANPSTVVITMNDFAEMARRIYGYNDKERRRMVFEKIRSLAFTEFTADIPEYYLDNNQIRKKRMIKVGPGTLFSYSYCPQKDEPDNGDAHEMRLDLAQIFYYHAHELYAEINIRNLEEVARKKGGGGIILRAALFAACNQPERVMHYKHGGDSYTLKIPYSSIFGNYYDALKQNRYNRRKEITDEVLDDIKNITAAKNVSKDIDGITVSFDAPK